MFSSAIISPSTAHIGHHARTKLRPPTDQQRIGFDGDLRPGRHKALLSDAVRVMKRAQLAQKVSEKSLQTS